MSWLFSIVLSVLPDLWIVAALGGVALWLYGYFCPGKIAAEIVRIGSMALGGVALWLWISAGATAACEARIAAATAAETARQREIVGDALTQARAEGAAAIADAAKAREALEAALDDADHAPDPAEPKCAMSRRWVGVLPK
jgi:hypothetical protein